MQIRAADTSEAQAITDLINAAFAIESFFKIGDRIGVDEVRQLFESGTFFVAEDGETLAGCVQVQLRGDRAYLGLLSVSPTAQRLGLGARLMLHGESYAADAGCAFVDIRIVDLRPELRGYYSRLGYVETGIIPFHAPEKIRIPCNFITLEKELASGVRQSQAK